MQSLSAIPLFVPPAARWPSISRSLGVRIGFSVFDAFSRPLEGLSDLVHGSPAVSACEPHHLYHILSHLRREYSRCLPQTGTYPGFPFPGTRPLARFPASEHPIYGLSIHLLSEFQNSSSFGSWCVFTSSQRFCPRFCPLKIKDNSASIMPALTLWGFF